MLGVPVKYLVVVCCVYDTGGLYSQFGVHQAGAEYSRGVWLQGSSVKTIPAAPLPGQEITRFYALQAVKDDVRHARCCFQEPYIAVTMVTVTCLV